MVESFRIVKVGKGAICSKCGKAIRKGSRSIVRQYRSPAMPVSGFYYYHLSHAPAGARKLAKGGK